MKNQKGQSTIEFILTFTVAVGFIFLFLKVAVNYTNGFMVHHATYLASRAYMAHDGLEQTDPLNDKKAEQFAKEVFNYYLPDGLISSISGVVLKYSHPSYGNQPLFTGVYSEFSSRFSLGFIGGTTPLNLRSESFLGREPTRTESVNLTCDAMKDSANIDACNIHTTLEDNGG